MLISEVSKTMDISADTLSLDKTYSNKGNNNARHKRRDYLHGIFKDAADEYLS